MTHRNIPKLTEPVPVKSDFVTGCGAIESVMDGITCSTFFLMQTLHEAEGERVPVIKRKILMSRSALAEFARMAQQFLAENK